MSVQSKGLCEFGPFRFDRGERTLWRDGHIVPLTPKALDTLAALIASPGRLVEKDDLMQAVWPDTFVEEGNLAVQISLLRKAFGEESYIETAPRRGYRFVAEVRETGAPEPPAQVTLAPEPRPSPATTRRWVLAAGGAALAAGGAAVWGVLRFLDAKRFPASVAILPFQVLQATPGDEALGMGLADAVITRLGALNRFIVRPTTAVRQFDQPSRDPLRAGTKLGVEAVLDATIQTAGDRVRLNAQLLRVADGKNLWADTFDLGRADLFTLEDEISSRLARSLFGESLAVERRRPKPEAHRLYLLGLYHRNRWTSAGERKAIEYAEQAIAVDPRYAEAHALKADAWSLLGYLFGEAPREAYPRAEEAARVALGLDERLAEAHHVAGTSRFFYNRDFASAERHLRRALELNPNSADTLQVLGLLRSVQHRKPEGLASMKKSLEIDPTSAWRHVGMSAQYAYAGLIDDAIREEKLAHELDPALPAPMNDLFNLSMVRHDPAGAANWCYKLYEGPGGDPAFAAELRKAYAKGGIRALMEERLKRMIVRGAPPMGLAQLNAFLGRKDEAVRCIERAAEERQAIILFINLHPMYAALHDHPGFQDIVRRLGL